MDAVIEKRIYAVKALLAQSHIPIKDIAAAVGYSDQSAFSKTFNRVCGISPIEYRSRISLPKNENG